MDAQQIQGLIMPIGILVIFYFFVIRPQKKREKEIQQMREEIKAGDKIVTIGGILGKIIVVKEDLITIETGANKTRLDLTKWSVGSVVNDETDIK